MNSIFITECDIRENFNRNEYPNIFLSNVNSIIKHLFQDGRVSYPEFLLVWKYRAWQYQDEEDDNFCDFNPQHEINTSTNKLQFVFSLTRLFCPLDPSACGAWRKASMLLRQKLLTLTDGGASLNLPFRCLDCRQNASKPLFFWEGLKKTQIKENVVISSLCGFGG